MLLIHLLKNEYRGPINTGPLHVAMGGTFLGLTRLIIMVMLLADATNEECRVSQLELPYRHSLDQGAKGMG